MDILRFASCVNTSYAGPRQAGKRLTSSHRAEHQMAGRPLNHMLRGGASNSLESQSSVGEQCIPRNGRSSWRKNAGENRASKCLRRWSYVSVETCGPPGKPKQIVGSHGILTHADYTRRLRDRLFPHDKNAQQQTLHKIPPHTHTHNNKTTIALRQEQHLRLRGAACYRCSQASFW